jgi:hypothetical protein
VVRGWSGFDEARADGVAGGFEAVAEAEFLEQVGAMAFDGLDTDVEEVGDLLGRVAFGDEFEDLLLAVRDGLGGEVRASRGGGRGSCG